MKKIKLNSKGITLIALVITIIILIILEGVIINLILGENGIIKKAKEAEHKQTVGRLLEKLELLKGPIQIDEHTVNLDNYLEKLDDFTEEYKIKYVDKVDENNAYVVLEEKYRFLIKDTEDGNVEIIYEGLAPILRLSETLGNYKYPESRTFTVIENESGGELSVSSSDENIAIATISGNIVTVKSGTKEGSAIITVKSAATDKFGENRVRYTAIVGVGTLNVTASPYNGAYDESEHGITVTCIPNDANIEYSTDGITYSTTKPTYTNVGTYTTYYKVSKAGYKTVEGSLTVTLTKATGDLTLSKLSETYTYPASGTFNVTNNLSGGKLSVTTSNSNIATATISGNVVTVKPGTTVGEATITVKSAETTNYNEKTITHTAKVQNGTLNVTASPYNGAYDGSEHGITVTCIPNDAKIEYSTDGETYSTTKPTYTNVGTYTTYYKVSKAGYKTVEGSLTVTLTKATGDLTLSKLSETYTYPASGTFNVTNNLSGGKLSVTTSNSNIATATISGNVVTVKPGTTVGEATITVKSAETTNYNEKTITHTAKVQNGTLKVTASPYNGAYDGSGHGITVTCIPNDAKIEYSTDGKTYSTTKPTYTNVGTYTTYYKVSKAGYKMVEGSLTVTIKDTTIPSSATIVISGSTSVTTLPVSLSAKVTHTDNQSGVKIGSCKYILNTSSAELGTNPASYTGGTFSSNGQTITIKPSSVAKWYLHVLTVDNAGNARETIKGPITVAAKYHTHTGNSTTGGGCYKKEVYHSHTDSCYTKCTGERVYQRSDWSEGNKCYTYTFKCYKCGGITYHKDVDLGYSKANLPCGNKVLTCNKTTSTITYELNCGKTEGKTIDSYTISY